MFAAGFSWPRSERWAPPLACAALALCLPEIVNGVCVRLPRSVRRAPVSGWPALLRDLVLAAAVASSGAALCSAHYLVAPGDVSRLPHGTPVELELRILETRRGMGGGVQAVCAPAARPAPASGGGEVSAGAAPVSGRLWLSWPRDAPPPFEGDLVSATGEIAAPPGLRNPLGFDFGRYLRERGIGATMRVESVRALSSRSARGHVLSRIERSVRRNLAGEPATVLIGLLLGKTGDLPGELMQSFRRSGTVHILSVSGLHVGFVVLIVYAVLRSLGARPRLARALLLPALAGLVFLIGPRPPVVRSSIMAAAFTIAGMLERRTGSLNTLGVAALAVLVAAPGSAFDLGFQLSFGAMLGMALFYHPTRVAIARPLARCGRPGARLADSVALSVSAQLGVAPVLVAVWGNVSLIAPLSNLAVVPLAGYATAAGITMLAADPLVPGLAKILAASAWASLKLLAGSATLLARPAWASVVVPSRFSLPLLTAVAALACYLHAGARPRARVAGSVALAGLSLALVVGLSVWGPGRSRARVVFFDVGQGDAALIEIPRGHRVLIDTGPGATPWSGRDAGRDVIAPYLVKGGIRRLDALVLTHGHDDHVGGLAATLEATRPDRILVPAGLDAGPACAAALAAAAAQGVPVETARAGDIVFAGGGDTVRIVGAAPETEGDTSSENDESVVVMASLDGVRFVFTGDIEEAGEASLLAACRGVRADVLKVPHHGGAASSSRRLLSSLRPRASVISVGTGNRHGHPSPGALGRLRECGCAILRTDADGAIIVDVARRRARLRGVASGRTAGIHERSVDTAGPTATSE